jgi:hypothetical protein
VGTRTKAVLLSEILHQPRVSTRGGNARSPLRWMEERFNDSNLALTLILFLVYFVGIRTKAVKERFNV